jgi:tetratricopeptide (TPR) repeat protein
VTTEREVRSDSDDAGNDDDAERRVVPTAATTAMATATHGGWGPPALGHGIMAPGAWAMGHGLSSLDPSAWLAPHQQSSDPVVQARAEAARGEELIGQGQYAAALERFRAAVTLAPGEAAYHRGLATAAEKLDRHDLAERHLLEAVRLDPKHAGSHARLARRHRRAGALDRALAHGRIAAELEADDAGFAASLGLTYLESGQPQQAWEAIERLITAGRVDHALAHCYARVAPSIGHEERALAIVERALTAPGLSPSADGKPLLHFSASALLDRLGRYDDAFAHARAGNELVRTVARQHNPPEHSAWVTDKIRYFSRKRLKSLPRASHESARPVFIVGMPRSGTTLVEQILATHPMVHGAGELNALRLIAKGSSMSGWSEGAAYPQCLDGLSLAQANRLAGEYLSAIDALNRDAAFVTDKQPLNYLLLDLVELLFPGCHVIHCVRNALDTCLSNYMTNFEQSNEFKFDLRHLGTYYRDYRRLMEHWKKTLTVPMLEVRYEDVILDTEGQVRRMLEFLGLPWDDRCVRYYEHPRRAGTASEDQVKRPIYTSSINRWKHYEKHLAPLIAALGGSGNTTPPRQ